VYAICRRLFDETAGLVAALFLALSLLHVCDSRCGAWTGWNVRALISKSTGGAG